MNQSTRMDSNIELDLAWNFVNNTDRTIFLTGKAGTGKTTFLKRLKQESLKRMVIAAPTGVAAINAKGVTIHSFFQLPLVLFYQMELHLKIRGLLENSVKIKSIL